jgi:hypothetical protein
MGEHGVVILIEVVLVFGGALAFGWWQLRDLERERRKRESARRAAQAETPNPTSEPRSHS